MSDSITWVGLDAHKSFIQVAVLHHGESKEWRVNHTPRQVKRLARKLTRDYPGEVRCCYEAGPCGFGLKRQLEQAAPLVCEVVAPALIPVKPGDRIKTDRRDARKLASYLRSDLLTEVHPPTEAEEAVRDLSRCREAIVADRMRARHRLSKWLLRRAIYYSGNNWTQVHLRWLRDLSFDDPVDRDVFDEYLLAVERLDERERAVSEKLERVAQSEAWKERVGWLRCFYGIDTVVAMTILAELHDFRRFNSPRQLMSYLGLTPSEHSSVTPSRGGITKTGNTHVRRMLVQVAHHYQSRPRGGKTLSRRREGQPARVVAIAEKAHQRCHRLFMRMLFKGKHRNQAVVAVSRELVGFIWAVLQEPAMVTTR
jgi:transposase